MERSDDDDRRRQFQQSGCWLTVWLCTNVGVTLLNKYAFEMVHFPYPYMLTALHMLACAIFTQTLFWQLRRGKDDPHSKPRTTNNSAVAATWKQLIGGEDLVFPKTTASLNTHDRCKIWLFSIVYSLNIGVGNVSLNHVSVSFNQVMRSLVPVYTLWISLCMGKPFSQNRRRAVWPVVIGTALAAYGDRMNYNWIGLLSTLLCVTFASVKVVVSSEFMTGNLKLHPLELLYYMAPAAFVQCLVFSAMSGEARLIANHWEAELDPKVDVKPVGVLFLSSLMAVTLNISALQAYKLTSPLTVCIASAFKQVVLVAAGTIVFSLHVTFLNGLGIVTVIVASFVYGWISIGEAKRKPRISEDDEEEGLALLSTTSSKN